MGQLLGSFRELRWTNTKIAWVNHNWTMATSRILAQFGKQQLASPSVNLVPPVPAQAVGVSAAPAKQFSSQGKDVVEFEARPYKLHKLASGPNSKLTVTKAEAVDYYKRMQTIRRMETTASNMYKEKKIRGFCHLYSGQEAIAVGMRAGLEDGDAVITAYRCHGWAHILGVPVQDILCELAGKVSGNVYGKGGSMHMYGRDFYGGNGIVGAQVPLGAGVALAFKNKKMPNVCVSLYGDGAANQGQIFEAMNMAALWKLPVIFVCENNGYGMGTPVERASASTDYYTRGDYIPGVWVDAMDVLTVREATRFAADHCRKGLGPMVLDMATYRYHGHSMSDPGTSYRSREEIQEVRKTRDPIIGFKEELVGAGLVPDEEFKQMDKDARKVVDDALKFAIRDSDPPRELLFTDLWKDTPGYLIRGATVEEQTDMKSMTTDQFLKGKGLSSARSTAYNQ